MHYYGRVKCTSQSNNDKSDNQSIITCNPKPQAKGKYDFIFTNWFFRTVYLHNHIMTQLICNYIIKSPINDVKHGCFTCIKHIK